MRGLYARMVVPVTSRLDAEIQERGETLKRDMELRNLAHEMGDWESVKAFEFRMRNTYSELLPHIVIRGFIGLMPHLLVLCGFYYILPTVTLTGGWQVSTVSAYIVAGVSLLIFHYYRSWRRRAGPAGAGGSDSGSVGESTEGKEQLQYGG